MSKDPLTTSTLPAAANAVAMMVSRCSEVAASVEKERQVSGAESSEKNEEKVEYIAATMPKEEEQQEEKVPPEEGLVAWLQVLGSFALYFNTW